MGDKVLFGARIQKGQLINNRKDLKLKTYLPWQLGDMIGSRIRGIIFINQMAMKVGIMYLQE